VDEARAMEETAVLSAQAATSKHHDVLGGHLDISSIA
jgi:hypothetical protein